MCGLHKYRCISQWNRNAGPEINLYINDQFIFDKNAKMIWYLLNIFSKKLYWDHWMDLSVKTRQNKKATNKTPKQKNS